MIAVATYAATGVLAAAAVVLAVALWSVISRWIDEWLEDK